jgi:large subunit ribosomal protein L21
MYAVIRTGGKQYRVQPGDLLVVEKLDGDPGAEIKFDTVLMLGDDKGATVGAPTIKGAAVTATLVETRRGEKIKIFKKTRRQGYRRTRGHRQPETVLRVTAVSGDGKSAKWDGKVELVSLAELNARARNLAVRDVATSAPKGKGKQVTPSGAEFEDVVVEGSKKSAKVKATVVEHAGPEPEAEAVEAEPAKKAAAPKKAEEPKPAARAEAKPKAAPKAEKAEAPKAKAEAKPKTEAKPKAEAKPRAEAKPKAAAPAKKPAAAKPAAPKGKKK